MQSFRGWFRSRLISRLGAGFLISLAGGCATYHPISNASSDMLAGKWRGEIVCKHAKNESKTLLTLEIDRTDAASIQRGWLVVHGREANMGMTTFEIVGSMTPSGEIAISRTDEVGHRGVQFVDLQPTMDGVLLSRNAFSISACYSTAIMHRIPNGTNMMDDPSPEGLQFKSS